MEAHLTRWLITYGAPVLFLAQALGIVGLPIPDELLLTIAGTLIAKGLLRTPSVVVATTGGCLTGITLSYVLGRGVGLPFLHARLGGHRQAFDRAERWFQRFGVWLLAFGYFIPGVRHVTAITAGSTGVGYRRFALFAYVGGVVWCSVFLVLGYYAGDRWREAASTMRSHLALVATLAAVGGAVYALARATGRGRRRLS
jgi:membrane protein DedA with SNARE-associated domain